MTRTNRCAVVMLLWWVASLSGCSATPEPLRILSPTYSFNRDAIDVTADAEPVHFDPVANADQ